MKNVDKESTIPQRPPATRPPKEQRMECSSSTAATKPAVIKGETKQNKRKQPNNADLFLDSEAVEEVGRDKIERGTGVLLCYMQRFGKTARETLHMYNKEMTKRYKFDYKSLLCCEDEINDVAEKLKHRNKFRRDIIH